MDCLNLCEEARNLITDVQVDIGQGHWSTLNPLCVCLCVCVCVCVCVLWLLLLWVQPQGYSGFQDYICNDLSSSLFDASRGALVSIVRKDPSCTLLVLGCPC